MSDKRCCILRDIDEDGPSEANRCTNEGVFPYYADHVCEPCAREMLPEDVLPIETIIALASTDASRTVTALNNASVGNLPRDVLMEFFQECSKLASFAQSAYAFAERMRARRLAWAHSRPT